MKMQRPTLTTDDKARVCYSAGMILEKVQRIQKELKKAEPDARVIQNLFFNVYTLSQKSHDRLSDIFSKEVIEE